MKRFTPIKKNKKYFTFFCDVNYFILFFIFLLFGHANAQVLDNRTGSAFTDKPFFNADFIRQNKLKKLNGSYTYKKQGEVMRETEYKYVYEFDSLGNLISTYETRTDDGTKDTTWNKYYYNNRNWLIKHSKTDKEGFLSIHYTHDSLGRVVTEEYIQEIDSNGVFIRALSFNKERIEYANYGNQLKRTKFNNYNLPYLDEFTNYNELGYLVERNERIKMTSTVYTYLYSYNEKGLLAGIAKTSNRAEGILEESLFTYDLLGNLEQKHIYKNGVFTTDIQIIYNSKSHLLSSVITRQVSTNFMMILRFQDYEFFD